MIVPGINVISELMRREPDAAVIAWIGQRPTEGASPRH
ncbi:hypothetical protein SPH9361_02706 [Sphingobium sp. CECT 9361]|jgi:predicted nucleic acid-binding protein|nr:hypothetical protein SPH9361_02706 [Sphingobium sp. CECT 9361]|tara:strand:- start:7127 stop:7240 length:114 start_codon:yes stop_codon:yes gene_type:complete